MSTDGQGTTKWCTNISENFNRLSRAQCARTLQTAVTVVGFTTSLKIYFSTVIFAANVCSKFSTAISF